MGNLDDKDRDSIGDETVDLPDGGVEIRPAGRPNEHGLPEKIGEFKIVGVLGQGGMGTVYEAFQESMQRKVALKVMNLSMGASGEARQRFEREAWIGGRLHHPNIVVAYSQGVEATSQYIAMELVEGSSLHELIQDHKKAAETSASTRRNERERIRSVVELFVEVADALHHAHAQGIVHRDIKPLNLLLTRDAKHMLISDFGLAHDESAPALTRRGDFFGTIRYMSPEQLLAHRIDVDHRSDIWSLGVSLYEAVTHDLPFSAPSEEGFIAAISTKIPRPARNANPAVDHDLETILMTCLDRDPQLRYHTCADLRDDLRRYLDDDPVLARRPGPIRRSWRFIRRRRREALGAAAAIMVVGAAFWAGQSFLADRAENKRLIEVLQRAYDEGRQPSELDSAWPALEVRLEREVKSAPRGEAAMLAMRAAVIPRAGFGAKFGLVDEPPSVKFDRDLFVQHRRGQYVVIVFEGSWDEGPWHEVGWCTVPLGEKSYSTGSSNLNQVTTGGAELQEGPHVLAVRANVHGFTGTEEQVQDFDGLCVSYNETYDTEAGAADLLADAKNLEPVFEETRELGPLEVFLFDSWPDEFPRKVDLDELERTEPPFEIDYVRLVLATAPQNEGAKFQVSWPRVLEDLSDGQRQKANEFLGMMESISVTPADNCTAGERLFCGIELHGRVRAGHPGAVASIVSLELAAAGGQLYSSRFTLVPPDKGADQASTIGLNHIFVAINSESTESLFCLFEPYGFPDYLAEIEHAEDMPPDGRYQAVLRFVSSRKIARETRQLDQYIGTTLEYQVPLHIITVQGIQPDELPE